MRGVNICCGREGGGRLGMTVHCSHDSVCAQCPADSWERSYRPCDVNSQHRSVSWPAVTVVTRQSETLFGILQSALWWTELDNQTVKYSPCYFIPPPRHSSVMRTSQSWHRRHDTGKIRSLTFSAPSPAFSILFHPLYFLLSPSFLSLVSPSLSLYLSIFPSYSLISTQACYTRVQASRREREKEGERGRKKGREQWREMGHRHHKFTRTFSAEALWHINSQKKKNWCKSE